jgi:hypothetical protein
LNQMRLWPQNPFKWGRQNPTWRTEVWNVTMTRRGFVIGERIVGPRHTHQIGGYWRTQLSKNYTQGKFFFICVNCAGVCAFTKIVMRLVFVCYVLLAEYGEAGAFV